MLATHFEYGRSMFPVPEVASGGPPGGVCIGHLPHARAGVKLEVRPYSSIQELARSALYSAYLMHIDSTHLPVLDTVLVFPASHVWQFDWPVELL